MFHHFHGHDDIKLPSLGHQSFDGLLLIGNGQAGLGGMQAGHPDIFGGRINAGDMGAQPRQRFA